MSLAPLILLLSAGGPWAGLVGILCDGTLHDTRATGFFVGSGLVATALHAVTGSEQADVPRAVTVVTSDGKRHRIAELEAIDVARDLCLLRIAFRNDTWLRPAPSVASGEPVTILGSPLRRGDPVLQTQIRSMRLDEFGNLRYRVDRPLHHRSGAPALDQEGNLVGLVSTTHELIPAEALAELMTHPAPVALRDAHLAVAASPQGLLDFAVTAYVGGDRRGAQRLLEAAVALQPPLAEAYNMLGVLLRQAGRYEDARAQYDQAIRIRPTYGAAYYNLGLLQARLEVRQRAPVCAAPRVPTPAATRPAAPGTSTRTASAPTRRALHVPRGTILTPSAVDDEASRLRAAAFFLGLVALPALLYLVLRQIRRR
jgi:tetratricopeptide (TPR) repeat protein